MSRSKLFIENFLVYGLGGIISKMVPLFMLPLVTRLMPNQSYYGLNDISNVVASFGAAIAIMGIYDAMFRIFFEKDTIEYKKQVCSSALVTVSISSMVCFVVLIVFRDMFSMVFFGSDEYSSLLIITAVTILINPISLIMAAPTRMQNKRKIYLITNTLSPIIAYSISIPMLLNKQYITALPLATLVAAMIIASVFLSLNHKWFSYRLVKKNLIKEMLYIGLPLIPNFLIYWVLNSADRVMIAKIVGNADVGLYGVAARVASVSQLIYTAFASGWQYFAFSTMKDKDQVEMNSRLFETLGILSFFATCTLASISNVLFNILFTSNYAQSYIIVPYLFLSPLLLMLFQITSTQLIVKKKTWPSTIILLIGAIVNIFFNLVLIRVIGYEGAAISTLIGYMVAVGIAIVVLNKMKLLKISIKFILTFIIMVFYLVVWRLMLRTNLLLSIVLLLLVLAIYLLLYKKEVFNIVKIISKKGVQKSNDYRTE